MVNIVTGNAETVKQNTTEQHTTYVFRRLTTFLCIMTMCLMPCFSFAADAVSNADQQEPVAAQSLDEYIDFAQPALDDASFDVSKKNGRITGTEEDLTFKEAFGTSFGAVKESNSDVKETINEAEGYQVTGESKNTIHVESEFGMKQILVMGELTNTYGAASAVTYDGQTLLVFDSTEATREAYEELVNTIGAENVLLDQVISVLEESEEVLPDVSAQEEESASPEETVTEDQPLEETGEANLPEEIDLTTAEDDQIEPSEDTEPAGEFKGWGTAFMGLDYEQDQFSDRDDSLTIAVLDSGINKDHEIFEDTTISEDSRDFTDTATDYTDRLGHGTKVSGIIAESTPSSVELLVLKVLNDEGRGSVISMLQALDYAVEHGARIANLSFGNVYTDKQLSAAYDKLDGASIDQFIGKIAGKDLVMCAASGNDGADMDQKDYNFFPAESPYTIAVGSIDKDGGHVSSSNYGDNLDLVAPGSKLTLATAGGTKEYATGNGTSFACPYISACAAYLLMDSDEHTPDTVRAQLRTITDPTVTGTGEWTKKLGYGMPKYTKDTVLSPVDSSGKLKVAVTSCPFNGEVQLPEMTVTYEGDVMGSYDVTMLTNCREIGSHTIHITLRGNYEDTIDKNVTFKIVPQAVKLEGSGSGKNISLHWTQSQGSYQVRYTTKKNFKKYKNTTTENTSKVITKLKSGKTYYVKVRACVKVGGKNYWSAWSNVKTIKIK